MAAQSDSTDGANDAVAGQSSSANAQDSGAGGQPGGASGRAAGAGTNSAGASTDGAGPSAWQGRTYLLSVPNANWAEPRGVGREIGDFVPHFLVEVTEAREDNVDVLLAIADATGAQDLCNPSKRLEAVAAPYPNVQLGPVDLPVNLQNKDVAVNATIHDLTLTDILPEGETPAEQGQLTAVMDIREVAPLFTLLIDPTADKVCTALEDSFAVPCEACSFDGEAYCLTLKAERLGADELTEVAVQVVEADGLDPSCPQ